MLFHRPAFHHAALCAACTLACAGLWAGGADGAKDGWARIGAELCHGSRGVKWTTDPRKVIPAHASPARVEAAVIRALDFLESQQQPGGFWQNDARTHRVPTTTWALLAFLAHGHTPQSGPYRQTVAKGLAWLANQAGAAELHERNLARLGKPHLPQPNAHRGQVLFVLLSAAGMGAAPVEPEDLVIRCERGVRQILKIQFQRGASANKLDDKFAAGGFGWVEESYWLTLCLLAARQTGIPVPRLALESVRGFWKRHYQPQHGNFYDQLNRHLNNVGQNYGPVITARVMIMLGLLGLGHSREAQGGMAVLRKCEVTNPQWWWNFGGRPYGPNYPSPASKFSGTRRLYMRGHARALGEWYLARKLCGAPPAQVARAREEFSRAILANQKESGAFRFPGWEFQWPARIPYGSSAWAPGYGKQWGEAMLTARCVWALGLPKMYLPVFTLWEERP